MTRTGIHNGRDTAVGGAPVTVRDCQHFGCRVPFHCVDCLVLDMFPIDPRLAQKSDETAPQKRGKRRSSEQE